MIKLFESRNDLSASNYKENSGVINMISVLFIFCVALILGTRTLGIAKDDNNYLNYFIYAEQLESDNLFRFFIEEPLWRLYTTFITKIVDPENALKFTIFLSSSLFLLSIKKVQNKFIFILILIFILHQDFATQMYFNQLRQGLALSFFLFVTMYFKRPFLGAILSVFIHTSFIFPVIFILLISFFKSFKTLFFAILCVLILLYASVNLFQSFDLGRREGVYEFEQVFTPNYYIYVGLRYIPILLMVYFLGDKNNLGFWYKLTLSSILIVLPFTLVYSAAGRLMYYVAAFFLIMIFQQNQTLGGRLSLIYYSTFIVLDIFLTESSMIENWDLIINH